MWAQVDINWTFCFSKVVFKPTWLTWMVLTSSFCVSMASRLGVGTGRGLSLTKGLMSSSSGRGFDEPEPTLWKLLDDWRTAMSPWTEYEAIVYAADIFFSPEPGHLEYPVLGDGEEVLGELAPFDGLHWVHCGPHLVHHGLHWVHHGPHHGLHQQPPHQHCGGFPHWGWARHSHSACSPCSRPSGPSLQGHPPTRPLKMMNLYCLLADIRWWWGWWSALNFTRQPSQWKSLRIIHFIVWDFERLILDGHWMEILIERERDVKIDGGAHRLERRSIEEQSLQIWWRW